MTFPGPHVEARFLAAARTARKVMASPWRGRRHVVKPALRTLDAGVERLGLDPDAHRRLEVGTGRRPNLDRRGIEARRREMRDDGRRPACREARAAAILHRG